MHFTHDNITNTRSMMPKIHQFKQHLIKKSSLFITRDYFSKPEDVMQEKDSLKN